MIGLVVFSVVLAVLGIAEAVGLYDEHRGGKTSWQPLTWYIRKAPKLVRWAVLAFCVWLVYHFSIGVI
jgi:hypothetical protein